MSYLHIDGNADVRCVHACGFGAKVNLKRLELLQAAHQELALPRDEQRGAAMLIEPAREVSRLDLGRRRGLRRVAHL